MQRLNRFQAAVIGAFTGVLVGPWPELQQYAEEVLGRPVMTHEFGSDKLEAELREAARADLGKIVREI